MENGQFGQFGPLSSGQAHRVEGNDFSGILTFGTSWRTRNGNHNLLASRERKRPENSGRLRSRLANKISAF